MRVAEWSRARFLLVENVPGLFSSTKGRDFAAVVGAMAGCEFDVPGDGWANAGVVAGQLGLVERTVLDAQYHGLAQRRRRVFIVRDSGDWTNRPPLFLEPYRLQGHPAPSREARQVVAGTIEASLGRSRGAGAPVSSVIAMAHGQGGAEIGFDRGPTLTCNHEAPIAAYAAYRPAIAFDTTQITSPTNGSNPLPGGVCHSLAAGAHAPAIAFTTEQTPKFSYDQALTLTKQSPTGGGQIQSIMQGWQVRRLTPKECERLQGFPDDYTQAPYRNKPAADGNRYKSLGNSMAVPCMEYIGRRIAVVANYRDEALGVAA